MEKIVIGGGQGSGKTTMLNELKKEFACIEEPTSYLIENGYVPEEHSFMKFQNKVVAKQKEMEKTNTSDLVFLDRCLIDTILYLEEEGEIVSKELLQDIADAKYSRVFFLEALPKKYWPMPAHKKPRLTSYEKGIDRSKKLLLIYQRFDIPLTIIPVLEINDRINFIKNEINKLA